MKRIYIKFTLLIFLMGALVSCDDDLNQVPYDAFGTANAFNTAQDFENAIRGAYSALTLGGIYGSSDNGSMLSAPDVLADNVTLAQAGRRAKQYLHEWDYNPSLTMTTMYTNCYSLIYRANQILAFAEDFTGENKDNIVAEAKALRALGHFNLVSFWGKIPTQSGDANSSLGVAYVTTADVEIEPARDNVADVYNMIVQDLTDAALSINQDNPDGRMGRDAVNILLSRVYLYMGQWQAAADAAEAVSASIASRDNFVGIWDDSNRDGLVFFIPNETGVLGNQIGITWAQGTTNALLPEYVASFELVNLYAADDIRKEAYIFDASNGGSDFNAIRKLFGRAGQNNGQVDYKILRASEAALNRAEAYFNLNQPALALAALNEVRTKRYTTPPDGETGNALRDAIRLERRLEFAFEYQRFLDLKRWGLGVERLNTGDLADGSGTPSADLSLPAGDVKFQMPFSQTSLDTNPNLVQNPGY